MNYIIIIYIILLILSIILPYTIAIQCSESTCGTFLPNGDSIYCPCYVWTGGAGCCRVNYGCYCDKDCPSYGDCCANYDSVCNKPKIDDINPLSGSTNGLYEMVITGSTFAGQGNVKVGGRNCQITSWSDTTARCTVPAGVGTSNAIILTDSNGKVSNTMYFNYDPPNLSGLQPSSISTTGGTVTITGTSFGSSSVTNDVQITWDEVTTIQGASITYHNHDQVRFTAPAGEGVNKGVRLTVAGQSSNLLVISYAAPELDSINPSNGPTQGTYSIVLTGRNFGLNPQVTLAGISCTITQNSDTQITINNINGQGTFKPVRVSVAGQSSGTVNFHYDPPSISGVNPTNGPTTGTSIVISGTNFGTSGDVTVGTFTCPSSSYSNTQITCTVPPGEGEQLDIILKVSGLTASQSYQFSYDPPTISNINPTNGPTQGGGQIIINGNNFGLTGTVSIADQPCNIQASQGGYRTHSQIKCTIPSGQGKLLAAKVTVLSRPSNIDKKFSYDPPNIINYTPTTATTAGGVTLTINGNNFGTTGTTTINGIICPPTTEGYDHTTIKCQLPSGYGLNNQVLVDISSQTDTTTFNYLKPQITEVIPSSVPTSGNIKITIRGSSMYTEATVIVIGKNCPVVAGSAIHSQVVCTVPAGRGTGDIIVTAGTPGPSAQSSDPFSFSYALPVITSISPQSGNTNGGTNIDIFGSSFDSSTNSGSVKLAGILCNIVSWDHSKITFKSPAGTGTNKEIVVTTDLLDVANSGSIKFSYNAPTITSISPNLCKTDGTETLIINGNNFGSSNDIVKVDGNTCQPISGKWSHQKIECDLPPGQGKDKVVYVSVASQVSNSVSLDYRPPTLSTINPTSGETGGNTLLTLTGSNFGQTPVVTVGGQVCTEPIISFNEIICKTPAGQGSFKAVEVNVDSQLSSILYFHYYGPTITNVNPPNGPTKGGYDIEITGTSFGLTGVVTVSGATCPSKSHSDTKIVCTMPPGEGTKRIVQAIISATASNYFEFDYDSPIVTNISPINGPTSGNIPLIVTGQNFGITGTVRVALRSCVTTEHDHETIKCTLPSGSGKDQSVDVTVLSVVSAPSPQPFSYDKPAVSNISPLKANTDGGSILIVYGSNFGRSGTITVGNKPCPTTGSAFSHTTITCVLPEGEGTSQTIFIDINGQSTTSTLFSYNKPDIETILPNNGPSGGNIPITLRGTSFGLNPNVDVIPTGGGSTKTCAITSKSHTQIVCTLPNGQGNVNFEIDVASQTSNLISFNYDGPSVTSIIPNTGITNGNYIVTIVGTSFNTDGTVKLGNFNCAKKTWDHTTITCTVSPGYGRDHYVKITPVGSSEYISPSVKFDYLPPTISWITPSVATTYGNVPLTLHGSSFSNDGIVKIDDNECVKISWIDEIIECTIPPGQGIGVSVKVIVPSINGQESNTLQFAYYAPTINYINPTSGSTKGTYLLNIYGINFGTSPTVTLGGQSCSNVNVASDHKSLTCTVPPGQGTNQEVQINAGSQLSNIKIFNYDAPNIGSVNPLNGPTSGNTLIIIDGTSFGTSGTVTIGGSVCNILTYEHEEIQCYTPSGEGLNKELKVIVGSGTSNLEYFNYDRPSISSFLPLTFNSNGGGTLTVKGNNFGISGYVTVGGKSCTSLSAILNFKEIRCRIPSGSGATNEVVVHVSGQTSPSFATKFKYNAPFVQLITPSTASTVGGTIVTITGASFGLSGQVFIGNVACPVVPGTYSHSSVQCYSPEGAGKDLKVEIESDAQKSSENVYFSYIAPTITTLWPTNGPTDGTQIITISGNNFGSTGNVLINNRNCNPINSGYYQGFSPFLHFCQPKRIRSYIPPNVVYI